MPGRSILTALALATLVHAAAPPAAALPRLRGTFTLDGVLDEWQGAACVPLRSRALLVQEDSPWLGPCSTGAEVFVAWNEAGLAVAARVLDRELRVAVEDAQLYNMDCLELFVDTRSDSTFGKPHPARASWPWPALPAGVYQFPFRPATPGGKAALVVGQAALPLPKEPMAAGVCSESGYTMEVLIPWRTGFRASPGTRIGFGCILNDFDSTCHGPRQKISLATQGARNLWNSPEDYVPWELCDSLGSRNAPRPFVALAAPGLLASSEPFELSVDIPANLAPGVETVEFLLAGPGGTVVHKVTASPEALCPAWEGSRVASVRLGARGVADGVYRATALLRSDSRKVVTEAEATLEIVVGTIEGALTAIEQAKLPLLAAKSPYGAAAWLGVAAAVERFRLALETGDTREASLRRDEVTVALQVAQKGKVKDARPARRLGLLALAGDPEGQVVVSYLSERDASVVAHVGALPVAAANVREYADAAAAATALAGGAGLDLVPLVRDTAVAGKRAKVGHDRTCYLPYRIERFDPAGEILTVDTQRRSAYACRLAEQAWFCADTLVVFPGVSDSLRSALASGGSRPRVLLAPGTPERPSYYSVAGDMRADTTLGRLLAGYTEVSVVSRAPGRCGLAVLDRTRIVSCSGPCTRVAGEMVRLVLAGKPITRKDVDNMRLMLVADCAPGTKPSPAPDLVCCDVHMHTLYSDGRGTPVARILQAGASFLDLAVMTDHNTLDGAKVAVAASRAAGYGLPIVVGEEITRREVHLNGYPLTALVSPDMRIDSIALAVHAQGGVIQINHPGYPNRVWAAPLLAKGIAGKPLDAWEHVPDQFEEWKAKGEAPALTGSTDDHSGFYGDPERTLVFMSPATGQGLAAAVKAGRTVLCNASERSYLFGPDSLAAKVWAALAEGEGLRQQKAAAIKAMLANADVPGMVRASVPKRVAPK